MSEPLRTEPADPGPLSEADRAARIEQLLLSGLDRYFDGHYDEAINVWTRVAFLERGHGRARAYIERARSALAERQRESEECLHKGVAAYQAGDLQAARELLTRAVELGGAHETALVFLQRLGRLDAATWTSAAEPSAVRIPSPRQMRTDVPTRGTGWLATVVASASVVTLIVLGALGTASWLREQPIAAVTGNPAPPEPLPRVRVADSRIIRARQLFAAGRSSDALRELAGVEVDDPLRPEADRLRGDIQRALLSTTTEWTAGEGGGLGR